MEFKKQYVIKGMLHGSGIFLALILIVASLATILLLTGFYDRLDFFIGKYLFIGHSSFDPNEPITIQELITNNAIIPTDTILTQTLDYYDTLIALLVSILGVVSFIAFFYIKGKSEDKAKEFAKMHTETYAGNYLKTTEFQKQVTQDIKNVFKDSYGKEFHEVPKTVQTHEALICLMDTRLKSIEKRYLDDLKNRIGELERMGQRNNPYATMPQPKPTPNTKK